MTQVIFDSASNSYRLDRNGKLFIARREGVALGAYQDGPHMSIGIGSNDSQLRDGDTITLEEAFVRFAHDVKGRERDLSKRIHKEPTQEQFNALFSCFYQSGNRIVPKLIRLHNEGVSASEIGKAFSLPENCTDSKGRFMNGLQKRRRLEGTLYASGQYEDDLDVLTVYHGNPRLSTTRVTQMTVVDEVA